MKAEIVITVILAIANLTLAVIIVKGWMKSKPSEFSKLKQMFISDDILYGGHAFIKVNDKIKYIDITKLRYLPDNKGMIRFCCSHTGHCEPVYSLPEGLNIKPFNIEKPVIIINGKKIKPTFFKYDSTNKTGVIEFKLNKVSMGGLITDMINKAKQAGYTPPYCLTCGKKIDISKYPDISEMQIDYSVTKDTILLRPLKG
jgi:hypothetical protein